ncbi:MAG: ribose transport system ATP-binding protein [Solirubrobacteraceae bacterium]|nr:ribose transport system ATP-binding protein [Solirubrobacteraceae bacterium]
MSDAAAPRLVVEGLSRRFGATVALDGVGLDLRAGEIHALLGANGSGKSTLIKVLAGVEQADAGRVVLGARAMPAAELTPAVAHEHHLRFLHQQDSTFGPLSVAENLAAGTGYPRRAGGAIDWRRLRAETAGTLERFGIDAGPDDRLERLRPVTQQMVAIARLLQSQDDRQHGILVLDEPTAALARPEVRVLHEALRRYAASGQAILYVTHRLDELSGFADRATVLREGRVAGRLDGDEIEHDRLVELISGPLGVAGAPATRVAAARGGDVRLRVEGLRGGAVRNASLAVRAGEIVGVAGLVGSGRSSLLEMLFGTRRPEAGAIALDGEPLAWRGGRPHDAAAYVPEDRVRGAAFMPLTVTENIMAASTTRHWRGLRLRRGEEARFTRALMREQGITAAGERVAFRTLSGGNQQKAILARWLMREPAVLLLDEPTQGVDIGARAAIHDMVRAAVARGAIALVATSDAEEMAMLCDRAVLLVRGVTSGEVAGDELTAETLERLSYAQTTVEAGTRG